MLEQAYEINSWGKNIYVKIPVVNSKGLFTGPVIKELSDKGIKLNITAVYTFEQTKKFSKNLIKEQNQLFQYLQEEWQIKGKTQFQYLKKVFLSQKKIKILKFFGLVQGKPITLLKQKTIKL